MTALPIDAPGLCELGGMEKQDKFMQTVMGLLLLVPVMAWNAHVIQLIWGWFLVPLGLPGLPLLAAFGFRFLIHTGEVASPNDERSLLHLVTLSGLQGLFMLGIAAAVHGVFS